MAIRRMKKSSLFLGLMLAILLYSCGETPVFDDTYSFSNKTWNQDDKPTFKVNISDTTKVYNFTLTLRTTTDYKYRNLWIFMKTETPEGITAREPFQIPITDDKGNWIGNKTGSIVESPLQFLGRKLPEKGTYTFTIEQGITLSDVDEVLDVGFRVTDASKQ